MYVSVSNTAIIKPLASGHTAFQAHNNICKEGFHHKGRTAWNPNICCTWRAVRNVILKYNHLDSVFQALFHPFLVAFEKFWKATFSFVISVCRPDHMEQLSLYWQILMKFDISVKGKNGKSVPLQAWSGPEGSRKLRFPDFMTTAQDGGKVVSLTHRPPLPPGNAPGTHFC